VSDTLFELVLGAALGVSIGSFLICLALTRKLATMAAMVDWQEREIKHLHKGYVMLMVDLHRRLPEDVSAPQATDAYLGAARDTKH
jgi:hypothetical protein